MIREKSRLAEDDFTMKIAGFGGDQLRDLVSRTLRPLTLTNVSSNGSTAIGDDGLAPTGGLSNGWS